MSQGTNNTDNSSKTIQKHEIEETVVKTGSGFDIVLWIVALALLLASALVNQYLPQYVEAGSNVWVRIGAIVACIIVALGLLYATHQGKKFVQLVKDSNIELKRVTWPTKQETITATWQVSLTIIIVSIILWGFDSVFGALIKLIIG